MLNYQAFVDVGLSPDAQTLQQRLVALAAELGFGLSGGALIRGRLASGKAAVHSFGNPPEGFAEASKSLDMGLRDPYLSAMLTQAGVHSYNADFYARSGAGDLWDLVSQFGYRNGMAVSIHEYSHVEMFTFGVDSPDPLPADHGELLRLEANLRLLSLHAHEAAKRLWTSPAAVDLNAIDEPELEALRWAADAVVCHHTRGLTVISHPGRTEAMRSAARKLNASSRTQAVLRAIDGGLIER